VPLRSLHKPPFTTELGMFCCLEQAAHVADQYMTAPVYSLGEKCYTQTHSPHINGIAYRDCTG
jgi:hypothetical protein